MVDVLPACADVGQEACSRPRRPDGRALSLTDQRRLAAAVSVVAHAATKLAALKTEEQPIENPMKPRHKARVSLESSPWNFRGNVGSSFNAWVEGISLHNIPVVVIRKPVRGLTARYRVRGAGGRGRHSPAAPKLQTQLIGQTTTVAGPRRRGAGGVADPGAESPSAQARRDAVSLRTRWSRTIRSRARARSGRDDWRDVRTATAPDGPRSWSASGSSRRTAPVSPVGAVAPPVRASAALPPRRGGDRVPRRSNRARPPRRRRARRCPRPACARRRGRERRPRRRRRRVDGRPLRADAGGRPAAQDATGAQVSWSWCGWSTSKRKRGAAGGHPGPAGQAGDGAARGGARIAAAPGADPMARERARAAAQARAEEDARRRQAARRRRAAADRRRRPRELVEHDAEVRRRPGALAEDRRESHRRGPAREAERGVGEAERESAEPAARRARTSAGNCCCGCSTSARIRSARAGPARRGRRSKRRAASGKRPPTRRTAAGRPRRRAPRDRLRLEQGAAAPANRRGGRARRREGPSGNGARRRRRAALKEEAERRGALAARVDTHRARGTRRAAKAERDAAESGAGVARAPGGVRAALADARRAGAPGRDPDAPAPGRGVYRRAPR